MRRGGGPCRRYMRWPAIVRAIRLGRGRQPRCDARWCESRGHTVLRAASKCRRRSERWRLVIPRSHRMAGVACVRSVHHNPAVGHRVSVLVSCFAVQCTTTHSADVVDMNVCFRLYPHSTYYPDCPSNLKMYFLDPARVTFGESLYPHQRQLRIHT